MDKMNKPLADRVLIEPTTDGKDRISQGGIFLPETIKDRPREGTIVEKGNGINDITGNLVPMEIQVGDRVAFHKNMGSEITIDSIDYLIMRESEILIILDRKTEAFKAELGVSGIPQMQVEGEQEMLEESKRLLASRTDEIKSPEPIECGIVVDQIKPGDVKFSSTPTVECGCDGEEKNG